MKRKKSEELTPDEVMLNPEYRERLEREKSRNADPRMIKCGRPLTRKELDSLKGKGVVESLAERFEHPLGVKVGGLTLEPTIGLWEIKGRKIPYIGVRGTF